MRALLLLKINFGEDVACESMFADGESDRKALDDALGWFVAMTETNESAQVAPPALRSNSGSAIDSPTLLKPNLVLQSTATTKLSFAVSFGGKPPCLASVGHCPII